ncbi:endo-1,4-beta-xylanase 5-like [Punica granatum]|uniref:GH10 domain-containing protein n=2 Tax=Punica granatum TaxID=22663 RepID=A0A218X472_PUNGR|nr:endo-1,4-beta-xylanase 5-like [Punica granatum]OWM79162.1 hypothetical protein CDL15_Pgr003333 [Punica granatum]PKI71382.1 hypothetical protein CRG98_008241 [Punica granatum]
MRFAERNLVAYAVVLLVFAAFLTGFGAEALSYDYTATTECLPIPHKPQYNGGIIKNPEFNDGLKGWSKSGNPKLEHRRIEGNEFIVAHTRNQPYDSVSQKIYLQKDKLYPFSAWIQVSEGKIPVRAVFKMSTGFKHAGTVMAQSKCWSMIKGGLTADESGPAELYFEAENVSAAIWVDSISLQPFTQEEWKSHQLQSIEKTRKTRVRISVLDKQNKPIPNANITIKQKKRSFPFGCAINKNILTNTAYQNWFTSRFGVTVFENEMKWYSTEYTQGKENYSVADAMLQFTEQHSISVRGHNVLWDDPRYQPGWVPKLPADQLSQAVTRRVNSIMRRYKGRVIGWDVVNENLHFSLFESKLGPTASAAVYETAKAIDGSTSLFLNEYNTIEDSRDSASTPAKYIQKINDIQAYNRDHKNLAIGLEGHFTSLDLAYMRSAIDTLGSLGLPIWLTEVDVGGSSPAQADMLEQLLREAHSHPKVNGIVIWSAWKPQGCYRMCLTDNNFKNLPTGNVVDKLLKEWGAAPLSGTTDSEGFVEASLFRGKYQVKINHPGIENLSRTESFEVAPVEESRERLVLSILV